jgi:hypothetical protein
MEMTGRTARSSSGLRVKCTILDSIHRRELIGDRFRRLIYGAASHQILDVHGLIQVLLSGYSECSHAAYSTSRPHLLKLLNWNFWTFPPGVT